MGILLSHIHKEDRTSFLVVGIIDPESVAVGASVGVVKVVNWNLEGFTRPVGKVKGLGQSGCQQEAQPEEHNCGRNGTMQERKMLTRICIYRQGDARRGLPQVRDPIARGEIGKVVCRTVHSCTPSILKTYL